jgi:hypothetical protein
MFLRAIRTEAVRNDRVGVFREVFLEAHPLVFLIADIFAKGADWQETFEGADALPELTRMPAEFRGQQPEQNQHKKTNQGIG